MLPVSSWQPTQQVHHIQFHLIDRQKRSFFQCIFQFGELVNVTGTKSSEYGVECLSTRIHLLARNCHGSWQIAALFSDTLSWYRISNFLFHNYGLFITLRTWSGPPDSTLIKLLSFGSSDAHLAMIMLLMSEKYHHCVQLQVAHSCVFILG